MQCINMECTMEQNMCIITTPLLITLKKFSDVMSQKNKIDVHKKEFIDIVRYLAVMEGC